jgi:hypothetical protein
VGLPRRRGDRSPDAGEDRQEDRPHSFGPVASGGLAPQRLARARRRLGRAGRMREARTQDGQPSRTWRSLARIGRGRAAPLNPYTFKSEKASGGFSILRNSPPHSSRSLGRNPLQGLARAGRRPSGRSSMPLAPSGHPAEAEGFWKEAREPMSGSAQGRGRARDCERLRLPAQLVRAVEQYAKDFGGSPDRACVITQASRSVHLVSRFGVARWPSVGESRT